MQSKKSRHSNLFYILTVLSCFFIFLGALYEIASTSYSKINKINAKVFAQSLTKVTKFSAPTPIITPLPTVAPTPAYFGYCLNVPVLMYHHTMPWNVAIQRGQTSLDVDNQVFDEQIGYLASHGYNFIAAEDLVNALKNHALLPPKSIVITLDDGYQDVYDYAFPVFKKYNVKATVMVPTGLMGVTAGNNYYYNWGQLAEMVNSGLVSVANHTWSHYPMGSQDIVKDQYEVKTSQNELLQHLGKAPDIFAYPYGAGALSYSVHQVLQQNGIIGAFSTIGGTIQCDSFIYSLHRIHIGSIPFPAYGID